MVDALNLKWIAQLANKGQNITWTPILEDFLKKTKLPDGSTGASCIFNQKFKTIPSGILELWREIFKTWRDKEGRLEMESPSMDAWQATPLWYSKFGLTLETCLRKLFVRFTRARIWGNILDAGVIS